MLTKREIDNRVNKLNKRLQTLKDRLGSGSRDYQNLAAAILNNNLSPNLTRDVKDASNTTTTILTRSAKVWQSLGQAGEDYLNFLEQNFKTFQERAVEIPKEYEKTFGVEAPTDLREAAYNLANAHELISKAWGAVYDLEKMGNKEAIDLLAKVRGKKLSRAEAEDFGSQAYQLFKKYENVLGGGTTSTGSNVMSMSDLIEWRSIRNELITTIREEIVKQNAAGNDTTLLNFELKAVDSATTDDTSLKEMRALGRKWGIS